MKKQNNQKTKNCGNKNCGNKNCTGKESHSYNGYNNDENKNN